MTKNLNFLREKLVNQSEVRNWIKNDNFMKNKFKPKNLRVLLIANSFHEKCYFSLKFVFLCYLIDIFF